MNEQNIFSSYIYSVYLQEGRHIVAIFSIVDFHVVDIFLILCFILGHLIHDLFMLLQALSDQLFETLLCAGNLAEKK